MLDSVIESLVHDGGDEIMGVNLLLSSGGFFGLGLSAELGGSCGKVFCY